MDQIVKDCVNTFNFHLMFTTLLNFCSNDLSAFYFDIRKDIIYCDSSSSLKRRSARSLLDIIFNFLVRWLAPSLSFTSEEAWKARGSSSSVHLEDFLSAKESYCNHNLKNKWNVIKQVRRVVTGALEKKRADKIIGSSLEAHIDIYLEDSVLQKIKEIDFEEITITSSFNLYSISKDVKGFALEDVKNVIVIVSKTKGSKCQRCWKYNQTLVNDEICNRCHETIL